METLKFENKNEVHNILDEVLKDIKQVNFREFWKLNSEKDKLLKRHYSNACIEILLKTFNDKGFSLCRKGHFIYIFNSKYYQNITYDGGYNFKSFLGNVALKMGVAKYDAIYYRYKNELYKQSLSAAGLKR